MYYLMLSAGTESDQERRSRISRNIKRLLQSHNKSIGRLAAIIDETWDELKNGSGNENSNGSATKDGGYPLGWLPTPHCEIYRLISEDVDLFLQSELDPLEALDLLAHLICFHIVQFIYHRSVIEPGNNRCEEGNCAGARSVEILVDALDGSEPVLRKESSQLYKVHEHSQSERAKTHIKATLELLSKSTSGDHLSTVEFAETVQKHFNIADTNSEKKKKGKEKKVVSDYKAKREKLCSEYELTSQQFLDKFADSFSPVVMDRFKDQFLGVHRKLCRSIGLVGPRKGAGQRFVLEDTLLKALVLANVSPHSDTTFDEFLARLYQRYGIVVGQVEAKSSGLYERRKINAGYYDDNRSALHEKLKRAGLLTEYSDATSLVSNRFKGKQKND